MSNDPDYLVALELQNALYDELSDDSIHEVDFKPPKVSKQALSTIKRSNPRSNLDEDFLNRTQNLVHPQWETLDPTPDIHSLFRAFDEKFFQARLKCVTLEWSKRMYSCAGICYSVRNRLGMSVTVRLSEPLLKLRPRKDLVETMLHEMIHAYCFVLNIREGNGGHGPNFKKIMYSINKVAGTNITVYHTFHDEVEVYKQHWWRCNGVCQNRSPFFGYVKRTCNRAPGPNDQWWAAHQASCGGTFMKIKGPDKSNKENKKNKSQNFNKSRDVRDFFKTTKPVTSITNGNSTKTITHAGTPLLTPIAAQFPPTSYPGPSWDPLNSAGTINSNTRKTVAGGNLTNVKNLRDLETSTNGNKRSKTTFDESNNKGYSLTGGEGLRTTGTSEVDRNKLRDIWTKRFENSNSNSNNIDEPEIVCITDGPEESLIKRKKVETQWSVVDDDIMLREEPLKQIVISSSSDEEVEEVTERNNNVENKCPKLTQEQRQTVIKKEIMDDTSDLNSDDIVLIDDEYDDESIDLTAASELADTSLIDEFFGEDTLLHEFREENDMRPSFSQYIQNPDNDIITCPICQNKMQRRVFGNHLDGCTGIAIRVLPSLSALKKLSGTGHTTKPKTSLNKTKKRLSSKKNILLNAGYTEHDLEEIVTEEEDEASFSNNISVCSVSDSPNNTSAEEDTRRYRQRNIFKTTRQCPKCAKEVEEDWINEHLDNCLKR